MAVENARLHGALEKQLKETLRLQDRLTEAERNIALEKLSAGIAHDFKNLPNTISGCAEILHMDSTDEKTCEGIGEIFKASDSAMDLVEQILAFTKQSPYRKAPVKSKKCFKQAIKLFRIFLPQNIQIHENLSFDDGPILANSTQIHHAITHIFKNAQDAIGDRPGVLGVESIVFKLGKTEALLHPGLKPGSYIKFTITDNGCGMDEKTLKQVFDPYFTTTERGVGTGMSLPTVQGIINDHDGTVSISSTPGKGTKVEILLPKHKIQAAAQPLSLDALPKATSSLSISAAR